jgi:hypothetical protein
VQEAGQANQTTNIGVVEVAPYYLLDGVEDPPQPGDQCPLGRWVKSCHRRHERKIRAAVGE